jgi:hypothetical protein
MLPSTRLPRLAVFAAGLAAVCVVGITPARSARAATTRQATPFCLPADSHSAHIKAYLDTLFTDMSDDAVELRDSLTSGVVDTSQIVLVTNDSLCERASHQLDSLFQNPITNTPVYLFRIDTIYATVQAGLRSYQNTPLTFWGSDLSHRTYRKMWGITWR